MRAQAEMEVIMIKIHKLKRNALSIGLCAALMLPALCGCAGQSEVTDLTGGVKRLSGSPEPEQGGTQSDGASASGGSLADGASASDNTRPADASTVTAFALRLFQESLTQEQEKDPKKNVLISPASVLFALSMTANGAKEQTLAQMEETLGASIPSLNTYLHE